MDTLKNKYGFFDSINHEYVINTPLTPKPWINYLGGIGSLDAFVSNRAGGTVWYQQPHTGRLTRYQYQALPEDSPGFYLYIKENNTVWNPSYMPCRTELDSYECRHGLSCTKFNSVKNALRAEVRYFIPMDDAIMLWDVNFTNESNETKTFKVYPYMDFSMRDVAKDVLYYHFCGNQMTGVYDKEINALKYDYFAFEAHHPGFTLMNASEPFRCYEMLRDKFAGVCGDESRPAAIFDNGLSNSEVSGSGLQMCGTFELEFTLKAHESKRVVIKLANDRNYENAAALLKKYDDVSVVDAEMKRFDEFWQSILAKQQISTPDEALNEMVNVWFPKNIKTTMRCGRSISHRHTGTGTSKAFRDTMQDIMSGAVLFPAETRENIMLLMHSIRENGQITTNIDPVSLKAGNLSHIRCDAIVWGIFTISTDIAETGDSAILNEKLNDYDGTPATVIELLIRAMRFTGSSVGKNGFPKLYSCDWNDSLAVISAVMQNGESIMVAQQYIVAAKLLIKLLDDSKNAEDIEFFNAKIKEFSAALDSKAWDGKWYKRLMFPDYVMGSDSCEEGKIFLNTQSWAAIAGTLDTAHVRQAMNSVSEILDSPCGIRISYPGYTKMADGKRYCANIPAAGENGGLFYHANTWAIIAEAALGNSERAWKYFNQIQPNVRSAVDADVYGREPYAFASWVYAPENGNYGKASLTHLTGGASWTYRTATEFLLGVQPQVDGIHIAPCIPADWKEYSVKREIAGAIYNFKFTNPDAKTGPAVKITVNGKELDSNIIPYAAAGSKVNIDIVLK